ncbi:MULTISPECIES: hypothetical protein [Bacillus]|uniref:hypothetical protein n=1 Tax=Bacillus TaxID=1386 RepID=UPI002243FFC6|nr:MULTISPECIES: hypothetical protein [Bacillus]MDN5388238.1 hypothetical protein [Bacillus sp. LB7]MEC1020770.1 hypothetical protein [Bacillus paralicheniformis]MEC1025884.1 hypothetical protein [Bacillus paralicheniformis]MEC1036391.1 hypothetical protein [Bacillus paralicheniformis]MEC1050800.1 hypothetical protein [Bacillus paralicheniformis]
MISGKRLILNCCIALGVFMTIEGCSPFVENNEIEEISPVTFWYIKEGKKGKISMSTTVPPVGLEKKRLFSTEVDMIKQVGKRFNLNYFNELKNGQLRMVMIRKSRRQRHTSDYQHASVRPENRPPPLSHRRQRRF